MATHTTKIPQNKIKFVHSAKEVVYRSILSRREMSDENGRCAAVFIVTCTDAVTCTYAMPPRHGVRARCNGNCRTALVFIAYMTLALAPLSALLTKHWCTAEKQHPRGSLLRVLLLRSAPVLEKKRAQRGREN